MLMIKKETKEEIIGWKYGKELMIFTPRSRPRFCGPGVYKKFDSLFKIYKIVNIKY